MLSQSAEQNAQACKDIERLLKNDLKETIDFHFNKFGKTFERKLGLTRDDLLNDMREQIWKGLLTHDASKGANEKTYLNALIKNRFRVLLRRSSIPKFNSIDYYADVYTTTGISEEHTITEETGETILERRQIIMRDKSYLSPIDGLIYDDLLVGRNLDEMVDHNKLPRHRVIAAINRIDDLIKRRMRGR